MTEEIVISEFVSAKIKAAERDFQRALDLQQEYTNKAAEQGKKADQIKAAIQYIKGWQEPEVVRTSTTSETSPLSGMVREYLRTNEYVLLPEITAFVQDTYPTITANAISTAVGRAKDRGEAERVDRGRYRSNIFQNSITELNKQQEKPDTIMPDAVSVHSTRQNLEADMALTEAEEAFLRQQTKRESIRVDVEAQPATPYGGQRSAKDPIAQLDEIVTLSRNGRPPLVVVGKPAPSLPDGYDDMDDLADPFQE